MNGRRKGILVLLLLGVYLLTVVAPVAHALSCPCLHAGHLHPSGLCCSEAEHHSGIAHGHLDGHGCCSHDHSAGVELYIPGRGEDRGPIRLCPTLSAVVPSVDALLSEPDESVCERVVDRPESCGCNVCLTRFALRAPPVSA